MCCISRWRGNWLVGSYEAAFREDMRIGNTQVRILCQIAAPQKHKVRPIHMFEAFPNGRVDIFFVNVIIALQALCFKPNPIQNLLPTTTRSQLRSEALEIFKHLLYEYFLP